MNWNDMDKTLLAQWQKVGQFRNKHVSIGAGANVKPQLQAVLLSAVHTIRTA